MIGIDWLSSFSRFFLFVNSEFLAFLRFLGIVLGFNVVVFLIACCLLFAVRELKKILDCVKED